MNEKKQVLIWFRNFFLLNSTVEDNLINFNGEKLNKQQQNLIISLTVAYTTLKICFWLQLKLILLKEKKKKQKSKLLETLWLPSWKNYYW